LTILKVEEENKESNLLDGKGIVCEVRYTGTTMRYIEMPSDATEAPKYKMTPKIII